MTKFNERGGGADAAYFLDDIPGFFTNVGKRVFRAVVKDVVDRLRAKHEDLLWF